MNYILKVIIVLLFFTLILNCSSRLGNTPKKEIDIAVRGMMINEVDSVKIKSKNVVSNDTINTIELINSFYGVMSQLFKPGTSKIVFDEKVDSLNYFWCEILANHKKVRRDLLNLGVKYNNVYLYGKRFYDNLRVPTYPNNLHVLFWIKILDEKDFMYGRRFNLGENNLLSCIRHFNSVFPVLLNNERNDKIPWFNYSKFYSLNEYNNLTVDFVNFTPNHVDSSYLEKIDSVITLMKNNNWITLDSINLYWISYEDRIIYEDEKEKLSYTVLGYDACD